MERVNALRDAFARLNESDQAFAGSLIDQAGRRGLTAKQLVFVDQLVERATKPKAPPVDVREIVGFMTGTGLARPQVILAMGEHGVRLSVAGPGSRTPGHINVTSAERTYAERRFYGRIGPDGRFDASLSLDDATKEAVANALLKLAADPAGTAAAYGHGTKECCFCRLPLTDERSKRVGYGRICAGKYNLPWGQ